MFGAIKRAIGAALNTVEHQRTQGKKRSPKWRKFCKGFLKGKVCAACGKADGLQLHHIQPFHLFPERELDETNVIPLCSGPGDTDCHLMIGHGNNFKAYVPIVDALAERAKLHPEERPIILEKAKKLRVFGQEEPLN